MWSFPDSTINPVNWWIDRFSGPKNQPKKLERIGCESTLVNNGIRGGSDGWNLKDLEKAYKNELEDEIFVYLQYYDRDFLGFSERVFLGDWWSQRIVGKEREEKGKITLWMEICCIYKEDSKKLGGINVK